MTSTSPKAVDLLADAIHRAMCFKGSSTPTCKYDKGDAQLVIDRLAEQHVFLARVVNDA